jgi:hypothetical protein
VKLEMHSLEVIELQWLNSHYSCGILVLHWYFVVELSI